MAEGDWSIVKRVIAPNDESYPCWLYINKCGTTTMSEVLREVPGGLNGFFHYDYPVHREVITMWRNPWDRIESAYRMYTSQGVRGWGGKSFGKWVTHICTTKDLKDPHMLPQYEVATNKYGRFVPDRVLLWDWAEVGRIYGTEPEIRNHTPGAPQTWAREWRDMFEKRFWLDIHIWNKVPD